jgi:hypothetical protein
MKHAEKTIWPSVLFLLGIISLLLLIALSSGCARQPKGFAGITNAESEKYFYFNRDYIVADNATHIVISIPKADKGVWIKYSSQWD